jgi:hypothetical protein
MVVVVIVAAATVITVMLKGGKCGKCMVAIQS